jgi:serine/threonine-protein phosphatase 2A regulatory subunit B
VLHRDRITVLKFDPTGAFLAVGDQLGRVVVFELSSTQTPSAGPEFIYMAEFQSHTPEFDVVRSQEVSPAIVQIEWLEPLGNCHQLLICNTRTIRFWRLLNRAVKQPLLSVDKIEIPDDQPFLPKIRLVDQGFRAVSEQQFCRLHSHPIHSLSTAPNGDNFLSADDLSLFLWNYDRPEIAFHLLDTRPPDLAELKETVTRASMNPLVDQGFGYSTSLGLLRLGDCRISPRPNAFLDLRHQTNRHNGHRLWEILDFISDFQFFNDGYTLFARHVNTVVTWDVRQPSQPTSIVELSPHNPSHPSDLYDFGCSENKFDLSLNQKKRQVLTGNYGNAFHLVRPDGEEPSVENFKVEYSAVGHPDFESDSEPADSVDETTLNGSVKHFKNRVLKADWSSTGEAFAVALDDVFWVYTRGEGKGTERPPTKISN